MNSPPSDERVHPRWVDFGYVSHGQCSGLDHKIIYWQFGSAAQFVVQLFSQPLHIDINNHNGIQTSLVFTVAGRPLWYQLRDSSGVCSVLIEAVVWQWPEVGRLDLEAASQQNRQTTVPFSCCSVGYQWKPHQEQPELKGKWKWNEKECILLVAHGAKNH